jgi:hypothetical protein
MDIYCAAKLVIDRHGEEASLYAAARTAVLAGEGDVEGASVWRQITAAAGEFHLEGAGGPDAEFDPAPATQGLLQVLNS